MSAGAVVWITGRPAAGKSTLAVGLKAALAGRACVVLDGDEVRALLRDDDHSPAGRRRFYETLADLAALLARQGVVAIVPATAHERAHRAYARRVAPCFLEVHVATSLEACAARDPKGLYARARREPDLALPGVSVPYEAPDDADVVAAGGHDQAALAAIVQRLG
jgi:adenylylsulfate kinase